MESKTCSNCQRTRPLSDFYSFRPGAQGVTASCRQCMKARAATYYRENAAEVRAKRRARYAAQRSAEEVRNNPAWRVPRTHADEVRRVRVIFGEVGL